MYNHKFIFNIRALLPIDHMLNDSVFQDVAGPLEPFIKHRLVSGSMLGKGQSSTLGVRGTAVILPTVLPLLQHSLFLFPLNSLAVFKFISPNIICHMIALSITGIIKQELVYQSELLK